MRGKEVPAMKRSLFVKLPALCAALLLAACGAPASEPVASATAEDASPPQAVEPSAAPTQSPETPQPAEQAGPLYWVDTQNDAGWYEAEWDYNTDTVVARYLDFDTATEQIVGEPLELPNLNADLFADDEYLYWFWSGMVNDTPILLRSNLDGSNRVPLYEFPQGTSLAVWNWDSGFASDGRNLYFPYIQISDDPAVPDRFFLARLDTETQTLEMILEWEPFAGNLFGVWDDRLLITRMALDEDCPLEPVYGHYYIENMEELNPWLTISLCALDPATGEEEVLYTCPGNWLDRQLEDGALWRMNEQHEIFYRPLGESEDTMLTRLPRAMQFLGVYTTDVTFNSYEGERDWLYLYDRTTGSLARSPQHRWMGGEDRAISVVCEAGPGQYVVIDDASAGMQAMADADGNQYLIDGYARYAIASRAALLDDSIPLTPVTRPGAA